MYLTLVALPEMAELRESGKAAHRSLLRTPQILEE
jgi:hypothetical protein